MWISLLLGRGFVRVCSWWILWLESMWDWKERDLGKRENWGGKIKLKDIKNNFDILYRLKD